MRFQARAIDFVSAETRASHLVTRLAGPEIPRVTVPVARFLFYRAERRIIGGDVRMAEMTETQRDEQDGGARGRIKRRKWREGEQRHNVRQPDNEVSLSNDGPRTKYRY